jgi:DNA-binding FrmR family transcriptional regulator
LGEYGFLNPGARGGGDGALVGYRREQRLAVAAPKDRLGKERDGDIEGSGAAHGYIKQGDKEKILARLRRIEGQVRGLQRMVDEEAYCVDILTQIGSVVSASEKVGAILLKDHVEHCVRESIEKGGLEADER